MQKTANQIKSEFELLASGHYQIHSFLYAQEFEQQAYENLIYPLMLVYPTGGTLNGTTYSRNYRVIIADRVLKSEGNELEVESDTQLIALDVLAYWMKLGQNERFNITSSNTITPFWEKWGDEVTGHFVDIGIEEFYDFNSCAIPLSSSIPSPSNPCKDARILINSVIYGNAPSNSNFNVVVKDQLGALVGSLIGGEWIVNTGGACADATYTIEDSLGNVLYTGTIPSGGTLTQAISNSTLNVNNSASTLISSRSILAQGTDSYNVADSVAVIKDSLGNTLKSENILATASENITINDSVAVIKDSVGATLKTENILAEATENISISDSVAVIKNSAGTTLKSENILAQASENITINDSTAVIKDSIGTTLKTEPILAEATENITINDSSVNVNKSDGTLISAVSVKAENTSSYNVGDSSITNAAVSPTYSQLVKATEGLILPTQSIQNNGVASGFIPSVGTINVTTNAAPTSFTITGRTIDIVVPSGGGSLAVDFSVNDTTPDTNQTITFTDLTIGATSWVWNFGDGTSSSLQNPTKVYAHSGVYNVTLSASDGTISGEEVKTSYITCTLQALPSTNIQMHNQALIGASPSNATLVSGAISQWNDAINSYHRTQGTAANRPTYLYPAVTAPNGIVYGAARFDGTNDFLINNNAGFTRATGSFEVIVLNIRVVGSVNVYLESASSGNLYEVYSLDNLQTIGMFNSTAISSIQTHHVGIYSVFYIHWNTTLSFMDWCNRSKRTVSSTPGNSSAVGSTMGAAFNGAFASPIDVLEHIIYTAKPSDADIALIQQRIIAQYGNIF